MTTHAKMSPSSAHRWVCCPGSVVLEADCPDTPSEDAALGTAAHLLAAQCLETGHDAAAYLGASVEVDGYPVDHEMAEAVQVYLDYVRAIGTPIVEQSLPIAWLTSEEGAVGTADAILLNGEELVVVDYKHGRGVRVDAPGNLQLAMYGLSALREYDVIGNFSRLRLVIVQPRLGNLSEWALPVHEIETLEEDIRGAAADVVLAGQAHARVGATTQWHADWLRPGEEQCRFCKARAGCPSLTRHALATIADAFVDLDKPIAPVVEAAMQRDVDNVTLGNLLASCDLIESWCKAIRGKAEAELLAGRGVPGFKLVEGKRGNRKWADDTQAEAELKKMRLKVEEMYDLKLISPTTAEKLHKAGTIGPRQWPKLQTIITRADGKPSVAPVSDPRPALCLTASVDEFAALPEEALV